MKIGFPSLGKYTGYIYSLLSDLGFKQLLYPPSITKEIIEEGVKYAPQDVCFPFKVTLGQEIKLLKEGADVILFPSTGGYCIMRNYWCVQKTILEELGFKFKMIILKLKHPVESFYELKKINSKLTLFRLLKECLWTYRQIKTLDDEEKQINTSAKIKIGLIGEIYTVLEDGINFNIVDKLQNMGCFVDRWLTLSEQVRLAVKNFYKPLKYKKYSIKKYRRLAEKYFPDICGGHANENIVRMIKYAKEGFSGVICLAPFACNPETISEPVFEKISKDFGIPFLKINIDENILASSTQFHNRVEAFIENLKLNLK